MPTRLLVITLALVITVTGKVSAQDTGVLSLDGFGLALVADNDSLDIESEAITIELWVKHDGGSEADAFLVNKGTTGEGYRLQFDGAGDEPAVRFAIRNIDSGSWDLFSNAGIPAHRWTHVAALYNGQQMQIYIDGELDNSVDFGGPYTPGSNTSPLTIGASDGGAGNFFSGQIDDLRIWRTARAGFDMMSSPYQRLQGDEEGLRAFFDFSSTEGINDTEITFQGGAQLAAGNVYPIAPDAFVTGVGSGAADLAWQERTGPDGENEASAFRVYRSTDPSGSDRQLIASPGAGASSYTDANLDAGQNYWYELAIVDADGTESVYSPSVVARPYDTAGGGSLALGSGSYGTMSDRPSLEGSVDGVVNFADGITIELWIKHDGESDADAFLVNKGTNAEGYRLRFVGSGPGPRLRFSIRNIDSNSWDLISEAGVPAHRWTHVAAVYNGAQMQLYINGELDTSVDFGGPYTTGFNDNALTIGASDNGGSNFYSGRIDELRIWNTPRSAFDLRASPYQPLTGTEDNLVTYFRFDDAGLESAQSADVLHSAMTLVSGANVEAGGVYPVPPNLVARARETTAQLQWTEQSLEPETRQAAAVRVYRSTTPDGSDRQLVRTLTGVETSFTDTELTPNTSYYYEVTAADERQRESDYGPMAFVYTSEGSGAVMLDGVGAYVSSDHHAALDGSVGEYINFDQSMSIELWLNHDGMSAADAFLVNKGTNAEGYRLQFDGEGETPRLRFALRNIDSGSWDLLSDGTVPANEWTHVAAVYNGSQMQLFINGELDASRDLGDYFVGVNDNALTIGASDVGGSNFFSGQIDDVRIWAVPRVESEIARDLDEELYGDEDGLIAYFRFDEAGGNVANSSAVWPMMADLMNGASFTTDAAPVPVEEGTDIPTAFALEANFPNPFHQQTSIRYALPASVPVRLTVFNALGQQVAVLVDETQAADSYEVSFDATRLPSGLYAYRLVAGSFAKTHTMVLVK